MDLLLQTQRRGLGSDGEIGEGGVKKFYPKYKSKNNKP